MRRLALLVALLPLAACGSDVAVGAIKSKLTIEPSFVDAGQIPVNSSVQVELLLVNEGPEVQVNEVRVDNEEGGFFTAGEELPLVPKDGSEVVTLTYSPSVPGRHWANITVYSDAENGAQFAQAIGEALLPAARARSRATRPPRPCAMAGAAATCRHRPSPWQPRVRATSSGSRRWRSPRAACGLSAPAMRCRPS
jgi:hypothetical protein